MSIYDTTSSLSLQRYRLFEHQYQLQSLSSNSQNFSAFIDNNPTNLFPPLLPTTIISIPIVPVGVSDTIQQYFKYTTLSHYINHQHENNPPHVDYYSNLATEFSPLLPYVHFNDIILILASQHQLWIGETGNDQQHSQLPASDINVIIIHLFILNQMRHNENTSLGNHLQTFINHNTSPTNPPQQINISQLFCENNCIGMNFSTVYHKRYLTTNNATKFSQYGSEWMFEQLLTVYIYTISPLSLEGTINTVPTNVIGFDENELVAMFKINFAYDAECDNNIAYQRNNRMIYNYLALDHVYYLQHQLKQQQQQQQQQKLLPFYEPTIASFFYNFIKSNPDVDDSSDFLKFVKINAIHMPVIPKFYLQFSAHILHYKLSQLTTQHNNHASLHHYLLYGLPLPLQNNEEMKQLVMNLHQKYSKLVKIMPKGVVSFTGTNVLTLLQYNNNNHSNETSVNTHFAPLNSADEMSVMSTTLKTSLLDVIGSARANNIRTRQSVLTPSYLLIDDAFVVDWLHLLQLNIARNPDSTEKSPLFILDYVESNQQWVHTNVFQPIFFQHYDYFLDQNKNTSFPPTVTSNNNDIDIAPHLQTNSLTWADIGGIDAMLQYLQQYKRVAQSDEKGVTMAQITIENIEKIKAMANDSIKESLLKQMKSRVEFIHNTSANPLSYNLSNKKLKDISKQLSNQQKSQEVFSNSILIPPHTTILSIPLHTISSTTAKTYKIGSAPFSYLHISFNRSIHSYCVDSGYNIQLHTLNKKGHFFENQFSNTPQQHKQYTQCSQIVTKVFFPTEPGPYRVAPIYNYEFRITSNQLSLYTMLYQQNHYPNQIPQPSESIRYSGNFINNYTYIMCLNPISNYSSSQGHIGSAINDVPVDFISTPAKTQTNSLFVTQPPKINQQLIHSDGTVINSLLFPETSFCPHSALFLQAKYRRTFFSPDATIQSLPTCECSKIMTPSEITNGTMTTLPESLRTYLKQAQLGILQNASAMTNFTSSMMNIDENHVSDKIYTLFDELLEKNQFSSVSELIGMMDEFVGGSNGMLMGLLGGNNNDAARLVKSILSIFVRNANISSVLLLVFLHFTHSAQYLNYLSSLKYFLENTSQTTQTIKFLGIAFEPLFQPNHPGTLHQLQQPLPTTVACDRQISSTLSILRDITLFLEKIRMFSPSCLLLPSNLYNLDNTSPVSSPAISNSNTAPPLLLSPSFINVHNLVEVFSSNRNDNSLDILELLHKIAKPSSVTLPQHYSSYFSTRFTTIETTAFSMLPMNQSNVTKHTHGSLLFGNVMSPLLQLPSFFKTGNIALNPLIYNTNSSTTSPIISTQTNVSFGANATLLSLLKDQAPAHYNNYQTVIKTILCCIFLGCGYVKSDGSILLIFGDYYSIIPLQLFHSNHSIVDKYRSNFMLSAFSNKISECVRSLTQYYTTYPCQVHQTSPNHNIDNGEQYCTCLSLCLNYDLDGVVKLLDTTHEDNNWVTLTLKIIWGMMLQQQQSPATNTKAKPTITLFELHVNAQDPSTCCPDSTQQSKRSRLLAVDIGHPCYPHIYISTRGALRSVGDSAQKLTSIEDKHRWIYDESVKNIPLTNAGFILTFISAMYVSQLYHRIRRGRGGSTSTTLNAAQDGRGYSFYTLGGANTSKAMAYKYNMCVVSDEYVGSILHLTHNIQSAYQPYNVPHNVQQTFCGEMAGNSGSSSETIHVDNTLAALRYVAIPRIEVSDLLYYEQILLSQHRSR